MMNTELHEKTLTLVKEERRITGLVIENLQKISDTKLFLRLGYSSLFEYCTRALGYSESSAYRRISAVKISRELPEVKEKLDSGVLNLTTPSMAQSFFTSAEKEMAKNKKSTAAAKDGPQNISAPKLSVEAKKQILTQIEKCSKREVEVILAANAERLGVTPPQLTQPEKLRSISGDEAVLQIRLSQQTIKKMEHIKSLRAHKNPSMSYADIIDDMCDLVLKKIDPMQSPQKKKQQRATVTNIKNSRYIPSNLKREVWQKDGGLCTYISQNSGQRCRSKHLLQFDHVKPLFLGGETSQQNLRLLCHAHHRLRDDASL